MKEAQVEISIGHGTVTRKVTPAECVILTHSNAQIGHTTRAGKFPLARLKVLGDAKAEVWDEMTNSYVPETKIEDDDKGEPIVVLTNRLRTDREEYQRLYRRFGQEKVEKVFPASATTLPENFAFLPWEEERDISQATKGTAPVKAEIATPVIPAPKK